MKQLMKYRIISGKTVEERKALLDGRRLKEKTSRGKRIKGNSTPRHIRYNEREAVKNLARVINCNFGTGDLWLTLTYSQDRLPAGIKEAKKDLSLFIRRLRRAFYEEHGRNPRYVISTSRTDSETGEQVRVHHHIVMEKAAYETVCELWPKEDVTYRLMDGRGDYTGIARYIVSQAEKVPDAKKWSTSRGNMAKPIYTEPVPVTMGKPISIPKGAVVREKYSLVDEETNISTEYVRYTIPERPAPPKPKDRKPRKKKKKARQRRKR